MHTSKVQKGKRRQHMSQFSFLTDAQSEQYYRDIIKALVRSFGLQHQEALRLLNEGWKSQPFVGEHDLRYHRGGPEDWVTHIVSHWLC
jgi:hypothetical protein